MPKADRQQPSAAGNPRRVERIADQEVSRSMAILNASAELAAATARAVA
jgi:hypothetical protein